MKSCSFLLLALLAVAIPLQSRADADTDAVKMQFEKSNPSLKVKSVTPSPIPGIYEIFVKGTILYIDKNAKYVIAGGTLIEDSSKRNLTAERLKELAAIKFDTLPFKDAIEIKKGNGAYRFAVFSDPDCPYCKSLEEGLKKLGITDYTAYVFLLPLAELHPDARQKAESIWCTKDRSTAWESWMTEGRLPEKTSCANPIDANLKLASELGVAGTPTIYLEKGEPTNSPQELVEAIRSKKQ